MAGLTRDIAMLGSAVEQAAAGDRVAFSQIVSAYHGDMVRVAFVVAGGDQEVADDAVQSAWSIAWRKLGSLHDPDRLKPWLLTVAANEARQLLRQQRRRALVEMRVALQASDPPDPAGGIAHVDLADAIHHLKPEDRALLALRYAAGLDSAEIAALDGTTASAVRGRLARLLGRLRKELSDD